MKKIDQLTLKEKDRVAIKKLKEKLLHCYPEVEIILYGSKAKGEDSEFSDIDILILLERPIDTALEKKIIDISYPIELECDVVFGLLIESREFWHSPLAKAMPLHWNIDLEGCKV